MNYKLKNITSSPQVASSIGLTVPAKSESDVLSEHQVKSLRRDESTAGWGVLVPVIMESKKRGRPANDSEVNLEKEPEKEVADDKEPEKEVAKITETSSPEVVPEKPTEDKPVRGNAKNKGKAK